MITPAVVIGSVVFVLAFVAFGCLLFKESTRSKTTGGLTFVAFLASVILVLSPTFDVFGFDTALGKFNAERKEAEKSIDQKTADAVLEIAKKQAEVDEQLKLAAERIDAVDVKTKELAELSKELDKDIEASKKTLDFALSIAQTANDQLYGILKYASGLVKLEDRIRIDIDMAATELRGVGVGRNVSAQIKSDARKVKDKDDVSSQILVAYALDAPKTEGLYDAIQRLDKMLAKYPDRNNEIQIAKGRIFCFKNKPKEAVVEFQSVHERTPKDLEVLICLAEAHTQAHDHRNAIGCYRDAHVIDQENPAILNRLYDVCKDCGREVSGEALLAEVITDEDLLASIRTKYDQLQVRYSEPKP